jgi:hypothetical protein
MVLALSAGLPACGTRDTGGALVSFHAYAAGLAGLEGPVEFDTGAGFHVKLTNARMHLGAVYMRLGQQHLANASCIGDSTYGLQVPGGIDVDVLTGSPQEFSVLGSATTDLNTGAELWLVDGNINNVASTTVLVSVAGVASKGFASIPFHGSLTIGTNRLVAPSNPAQPGANPICKERIIALIPVAIRPTVGGNLLLRIDPRPWFGGIDFETLVPGTDGMTSEIPDSSNGSGADAPAGRAFFQAVTSAAPDTYQFSWFVP